MTLARSASRSAADIVCLSHLSWNFVYQRPNHLMARAARTRRVFFIEEPQFRGETAHVEAVARDGLTVVSPVLPEGMSEREATQALRQVIDRLLASEGVEQPWLWYYTPMALPWTSHVAASAVIYDCMDELSGFRFAPPALLELEQQLLDRSDVVFTGGQSLYEAKRHRHPSTFVFPSSVDAAHFRQARDGLADPPDQQPLARPRVGYFGVIDERIDLELIGAVANARPEWQLVMVGPTTKVDTNDLPRAPNIHWLGMKSYDELPSYLSGWDVALMPFALNEATRHISPTKTPEYLAGGRPVVSTPIRDVVRPYGEEGLVYIADDAGSFIGAVEEALSCDITALRARADRFLASQSWNATWVQMEQLVNELTQPAADPTPLIRRLPASYPAAVPAVSAARDTATPTPPTARSRTR